MNKVFTENGWADYTFWETEDRKTLKKINKLIEDICRNGNEGIGKPEALSGNLAGYWSRRINDKDRLIYKIDENNVYDEQMNTFETNTPLVMFIYWLVDIIIVISEKNVWKTGVHLDMIL